MPAALHMTRSQACGFSLLELSVFICIMALIYWAIAPRIGDGMKLAHEQTLVHTAAAFRDSLSALQHKHLASAARSAQFDVRGVGDGKLDLNAEGYPLGNSLQPGQPFELTGEHCAEIWLSLLGPVAPAATLVGDAPFRVMLHYDSDAGLGCHYEYRLAGRMSIDYFPERGLMRSDAHFE